MLLRTQHVLVSLLVLPFFILTGIILTPFAYIICIYMKIKMLRTTLTKKSKTERWLDLVFYIFGGLVIQTMNTIGDIYFLFDNLYREEEKLILREEPKIKGEEKYCKGTFKLLSKIINLEDNPAHLYFPVLPKDTELSSEVIQRLRSLFGVEDAL